MNILPDLPTTSDWIERTLELATPCLVVDFGRARRNVDKLAAYAAGHKLGVRPHTKTHKSKALAALQIEAGAVGLTAAKVGEAERMAEVHRDILVAYPAFDPYRAPRLARLARNATVRVAVAFRARRASRGARCGSKAG